MKVNSLLANDDLPLFYRYFGKVTFFAHGMGILHVDINNINRDDEYNLFKDNAKTINDVRLLTLCNKFEIAKHLKRYNQKINT